MNLPDGAGCKAFDGSQCDSGRCHDFKCTSNLPPFGDAINPAWHAEQAAKRKAKSAARQLAMPAAGMFGLFLAAQLL